jgi:hypothetical protein
LICLDCVHKTTDYFQNLDLCCKPQCVEARLTHRGDLETAHEPDHRLVKARTPVLARHYGCVYSAAWGAFERIEDACAKIAESSANPQEPQEEEASGADEQKVSNDEPAVGEMPVKIDNLDNTLSTQDDTRDGAKPEDDAPQGPTRDQDQDGNLPKCGNCKGSLSFPCWYCIFCEGRYQSRNEPVMRTILKGLLRVILDDLFICDVCDGNGVPDLTRSSGKHTEHHHLIRCRAPRGNDYMSSLAEQRLLSVESRINGMQAQLDDLSRRMGELTGCLGDQNGLIGELTNTIGALTSRIGGIELLLHKLTGTANDTV